MDGKAFADPGQRERSSSGKSPEVQRDEIAALLQRSVAEGKAAGYVVKILQRGEVLFEEAIGEADLVSHAPMRLDTRFALASMSKPFTSVAVMQLYEQGMLRLEDRAAQYLPELGRMALHGEPSVGESAKAGAEISIHQLLTHTSGLSYGAIKVPGSGNIVSDMYYDAGVHHHRLVRDCPSSSKTLAEMIDRLAAMPLSARPGETWEYSIASDVLARIIEIVSGERFDHYLQAHIFEPLGMHHTAFYCPDREAIATIYEIDGDGTLKATDATERYVAEPTYFGGGGELLSTAGDYARFGQMLLSGGTLEGIRVLREASVSLMTQDHLSSMQRGELVKLVGASMEGFGFGYGFTVAVDPPSDYEGQIGEFFWNGGGGTVNWMDPKSGIVAVILKHVRFDPSQEIAMKIRKILQA
jgi:CubicO group peptidase (beta-lactamase class C family)